MISAWWNGLWLLEDPWRLSEAHCVRVVSEVQLLGYHLCSDGVHRVAGSEEELTSLLGGQLPAGQISERG